MKHVKGTLVGQRSLRLVYASFQPEQSPKAVAVLVHGYGEHLGRYHHVIEVLVQRGYAVYGIDHRGHGGSQGSRALVERFEFFVGDLWQLVRQAQATHPNLPMFMIGHSMGGLIAFHYAVRFQAELAGLVLSGPLLESDAAPHLKRIVRVLGKVAPWLPVAPVVEGAESALSRDPRIQELFDADPLTYKQKMKAGMGYQLMRAIDAAQEFMPQITLPLLVMQGECDRMVSPNGAKRLYEQARSSDKTLKLYPECRHEIFNELEKDEIIGFVADWLDERLAHTVGASADHQFA